MKVIELIEEFESYRSHSGGMPTGVALGPADIEALQLELAAEASHAVHAPSEAKARRLPVPNHPGDVYAMTIIGVPVFSRAGLSGIEMWRDRS